MKAVDARSRAIFFDLFGTLVFFDAARLPRVRIAGVERPATIAAPDDLLARLVPTPTIEQLYAALQAASVDYEEEAHRTFRERPSRERFLDALRRLDVRGDLETVAEDLSLRHMAGLAHAVVCPEDRRDVLATLRRRYRIALISNFDHTSTALSILRRDGLVDLFDAVLVSEAVGLRKPHPRLFELACERVGLEPSQCLHVGDSHRADVRGATDAGVRAVWIDASDVPHAPAIARLSDIRHLPEWLARSVD